MAFQDKAGLYKLILAQLRDDGFDDIAAQLGAAAMVPVPSFQNVPRGKLEEIVKAKMGITALGGASMLEDILTIKSDDVDMVEEDKAKLGTCLDFDVERRIPRAGEGSSAPKPTYAHGYTMRHQKGCTCAAFSTDSKLIATAGVDAAIKLWDVSRIKNEIAEERLAEKEEQEARRNSEPTGRKDELGRDILKAPEVRDRGRRTGFSDKPGKRTPLLQTYFDHDQEITDVCFHPQGRPVLVTASRDCTIRLFDIKKGATGRAFRFLKDTHPVRSIAFHPSGDFIVTGTEHHVIRTYDISTFQAFVSAEARDHHRAAINQVRYSPDHQLYASCSKDGDIRLWDPVSGRCVRHIARAHSGREVSSIRFSRNGKYLLSSGKDSSIRLWEVATATPLLVYAGCTNERNRVQASFSHDENYVLGTDEASNSVFIFDTRTAELRQRVPAHTSLVNWVVNSTTEASFVSCGDDKKAVYWTMG
eukprot:TRINITY_DN1370_c0_g3_i1.p1 TRINITY_DN1370_c0_g3~~TRINITY_DN1370_c0_g3_i1.p1  ORF type:complete len:474 (+),score=95.53 TRINITY_DN1370_c0_g3_i1:91-1512(+)